MTKAACVMLTAVAGLLAGAAQANADRGCGFLGLGRCSYEIPDEVRGLERIDVSRIVAALENGSQFCNRPRPAESSCTTVQRLRTVNEDGISVSMISREGLAKVTSQVRLVERDNMLCRSSSAHIPTYTIYRTFDDRAEIGAADRLAATEDQERLRAHMQTQIEPDREFCWSYWRVVEPTEGLNVEIVMPFYIDGVLQPFDATSTATIYTADSTLRLRGAAD